MVGIQFEVPNVSDCILEKIFYGVDIKQYLWRIQEDDIYLIPNSKENQFLFTSNLISGDAFKKKITTQEYLIVFANLQAFLSMGDIRELNNYHEYFESACQIVVLITDTEFVKILSKKACVLHTIYNNALKNKFTNIKFISTIQDPMSVLTAR